MDPMSLRSQHDLELFNQLLQDPIVKRVNEQISAGEARNRAGEPVREPLDSGLVPEGEDVLYPVRDDIPILLKDEAIPFSSGTSGGGEG